MQKLYSLLFVISLHLSVNAQTYSGLGDTIPDDATTYIDFTINVSGLSPSTIDTNFGLKTVCLNITHTWNADLEMRLFAPDGTNIPLSLNNGGDSDDYNNTCFDQQVSTSILSATSKSVSFCFLAFFGDESST